VEGSFGSQHVHQGARRVTGLAIVALAILAGIAGVLLLRRSGSGWRVGRLLAAAPRRSLAEATALATRGETAYVRVHGRIDSEEEFPADDGKPLVFRRRRLQRRSGRSDWQTFDDERLAVPFGLSEKGQRLDIDTDALGDGLVVVPRESEGVAADVTAEAVAGSLPVMAPDTPVRLRIEQVSAVDHATAAGVPRLADGGSVVLGPGLGRPLVLTTLEVDEAMRVLAGGRRHELLLAAGLIVATPVLVVVGFIALVLGW
jgi:hypothetical protein